MTVFISLIYLKQLFGIAGFILSLKKCEKLYV